MRSIGGWSNRRISATRTASQAESVRRRLRCSVARWRGGAVARCLGGSMAYPSFDVSQFLTCTDGIGEVARLPGRTRDGHESMTRLRAVSTQCPHACTRGDRIQPMSASNQDRRYRRPNAPGILWKTRNIERSRFRFDDGRLDRSGRIASGKSCRKVSPHLGTPGRLFASRAGPAVVRCAQPSRVSVGKPVRHCSICRV